MTARSEPLLEEFQDRLRHVRAASAVRPGAPQPCELCSATGTQPFGHLTQLRSLTVQVWGGC